MTNRRAAPVRNRNSPLRTSHPDIYGAGDVASFNNPALAKRLRNMFELGYEAVGELDSRLEIFADWKEPHKEGVNYYLQKKRVRGVLLWNVWGQVDAARALIAEPGPFQPENSKGRLK